MDSVLLSKIVVKLLPRKGSLVLPGLGCFVAREVPASFSDKGFTINPPYLKVAFEPFADGEQHPDDDALVRFYAGANDLSLSRARDLVKECVATICSELSMSKVSVLPGLGRFKMARGGMIFFVEDEGLQLFPSHDFLEPVSLKSLSFAEPEPAPAAEPEPEFAIEPVSADPEPVPTEPAQATDPESEPVAETVPTESTTESDPEPVPTAPADEPAPSPAAVPEPAENQEEKAPRGWGFRILLRICGAILLLALVALAALAVLGRTMPEIVDPFLYSAEELEILRFPLK